MIDDAAHGTFRRCVDAARNAVLMTHTQPDGDAIGSEIALQRFLVSRGVRCTILNDDPVADALAFAVPEDAEVCVWDDVGGPARIREADTLFLVDNAAAGRLGRLEPYAKDAAPRTLCIDHHPGEEDAPWAESIVDTSAGATALMIHELVTRAGWTPDAAGARALYLGLATDTGFFRYNSTDGRTHRAAAELIDAGADPADTYRRIHERNTVAYTRLLGYALSTLRMDAAGRVATVRLENARLAAIDAVDEDTSEVTSHLLAIDGVRAVALFRERPDGRVKISLRSKDAVDVQRLASARGGGGHRNAAGAVVEGDLASVADGVIADLVRAVA